MVDNNNRADIQLGLAYDRAVKQGRLFMLLFLASMLMNAALTAAVIIMMPLKEIKPYFMPISKAEDHYYKIIPADKLARSQLLELVRDYLKRYVIDRHTVDNVTETIRFKRVIAQSNAQTVEQARNEYRKFQEYMSEVGRQIEIISDIQLEPYYHQIEFKTVDTTQEGQSFEKYWVVNIRYQLAGFNAPKLAINADELKENPNPLGLIVTNYAWTQRRNVTKEVQNE